MVGNGLLLLTSTTRSVLSSSRLKYNLIAASNRLASGVLYVYHWFPPGGGQAVPTTSNEEPVSKQITRYSRVSSKVYSHAQQYCPKPDIRFLFEKSFENNSRPSVPIDLVLVETQHGTQNTISKSLVKNFVEKNFRVSNPDFEIEFIEAERGTTEDNEEVNSTSSSTGDENTPVPFNQLFPTVALGGTFDRMHIAHKILISEAVLRCRNELIIGVTDDEMIKSNHSS